MRFHFTASKSNISLLLGGRMYSIPATHAEFEAVYEHLKLPEHDFETLEGLIDRPVMMARMAAGLVTVVGNTVYYAGTALHNSLAVKLSNMLNEGFDAKPWGLFLNNLMENPNPASVQSLYDFLDQFDAPITEDGHFLAFKRVRDDYMDMHSGTMDNSPGNIVEMDRADVDADSSRTCSAGLHACATSYLGDFYADTANGRILVLKINPRDVVAVPSDYNFAKMRVCRYEVIGDVDNSPMTMDEIESTSFIDTTDVTPTPEIIDLDDFVATYGEPPMVVGGYVGIESEVGFLISVGLITAISEDHVSDEVNTVTILWDGNEMGNVEHTYTWSRIKDNCCPVLTADAEEDLVDIDAEILFQHHGEVFGEHAIITGVSLLGQRGYSRSVGVPRTTIQEWLKTIASMLAV